MIALAYAEPFFEIASENDLVEKLHDELEACVDFLGKEEKAFFDSPFVQFHEKKQVLENTLQGRVNDYTLGLLVSMARRRRVSFVGKVLSAYVALLARSEGVEQVLVTLSAELSKEAKQDFEASVKEIVGVKACFEYRIDAGILGGVIIEHNDTVIDNSVRNNMNKILSGVKKRFGTSA
jgi:F-type H+-transporting ATPase subunit delta